MTAQTMPAVAEADVCLFMIDGREGVTTADEIVAQSLRRAGKPIVLAANKCESRNLPPGVGEAWKLGFGEPIAVSAEHRRGLEDLAEALEPFARKNAEDEDAVVAPLRLAIVGGRMSANRACSTACLAASVP